MEQLAFRLERLHLSTRERKKIKPKLLKTLNIWCDTAYQYGATLFPLLYYLTYISLVLFYGTSADPITDPNIIMSHKIWSNYKKGALISFLTFKLEKWPSLKKFNKRFQQFQLC